MKQTSSFLWELSKVFIIALVIVIPIRYFLFQPFIVKGDSMVPNFHSGDYLIIDEISYRFSEPKRGEVIVFKYPENPSQKFIKRIIGVPGETVEVKDGQVLLYDKDNNPQVLEETYLPSSNETYGNLKVSLGDDQYFVLGDNRPYSSDSRTWGTLPRENIIGRVLIRVFPLASLGKITLPAYAY